MHFSWKGFGNVLFELGSKMVNNLNFIVWFSQIDCGSKNDQVQVLLICPIFIVSFFDWRSWNQYAWWCISVSVIISAFSLLENGKTKVSKISRRNEKHIRNVWASSSNNTNRRLRKRPPRLEKRQIHLSFHLSHCHFWCGKLEIRIGFVQRARLI